jgi:uroporphyrin-III C-methyltransferase / precorrin-2 dehydrogenase / sirohydrochlorin ferrochelatase
MHSLPLFVRLQGRAVILVGDGDAAAAKRRLLERAGAVIGGEETDAALAFVAVDDDEQAEAACARLKARGVLVNATDRPALCDFTIPAIVDRDPVLIAIGTGGASAGLAKALRQRLETLLPASLGRMADAFQAARGAMRTRWPDGGERRQAIDAALSDGGAFDPMVDHGNRPDLSLWMDGTVESAGEAIHRFELDHDDPDLLTLAQARLLAKADTVFHSPMIAPAILDRARADARRIEWWSTDDPPAGGLVIVLMKAMR